MLLMEGVLSFGEDMPRIRRELLPHRLNPKFNKGKWSLEEKIHFFDLIKLHGLKWTYISNHHLKTRSPPQLACFYNANRNLLMMESEPFTALSKRNARPGRGRKSDDPDKPEPQRGERAMVPWTKEENERLIDSVERMGYRWSLFAEGSPYRTPSDLFQQYWLVLFRELEVDPSSLQDQAPWTPEEDAILLKAVNKLWDGTSVWLEVRRKYLPGRALYDIQRRWRSLVDPRRLPVPFTPHEKVALKEAVAKFGPHFKNISKLSIFDGRTTEQLQWLWDRMTLKERKRPWTAEEDTELLKHVENLGFKWLEISKLMQKRLPNDLKFRYMVIGVGTLQKGPFLKEEDEKLLKLRDEDKLTFFEIAKRMARSVQTVHIRYKALKKKANTQKLEIEKVAPIDLDETVESILRIVDQKFPGGRTDWKRIAELHPNAPVKRLQHRILRVQRVWSNSDDTGLIGGVLEESERLGPTSPLSVFLVGLRSKAVSTFKQITPAQIKEIPSTSQERLEELTKDVNWKWVSEESLQGKFSPERAKRRWIYLAYLDELLEKPIVVFPEDADDLAKVRIRLKQAADRGELGLRKTKPQPEKAVRKRKAKSLAV
ncbi:Myblike DNAbinding domain-containing protein [Phlyctochytrium planicorne]|nr:Myblike DNAbinding domain-containing protein [Phlyctochytrium planicorne]